MIRVVVDQETLDKLHGLKEGLELHDENGRWLGNFSPSDLPPGVKSLKELSPFSDEEIERRRAEQTGRPLKEILEDLESQTP